MTIKQASHSFRGMRKDISPSKASPEYIIDALNIRLTPNGRDSLFSITCERYPELKISIPAKEIWSSINNIKIEYQHYCIINNFLILFLIIEGVAGKNTFVYNTILKIDLSDITALDTDYSKYILFSGWKNKNTGETYNYLNLNSSIDSLASYENDEIQKIYWVDGVNQPRVINIAANEEIRSKWNEKSFDFIKELNLQEVFKVEKLYQYGMFAPGVIQYCYTYFNKNGGETNIVDISPLLYISEQNKGTSPEKFVTDNCFKINIGNADTSFDCIRVYSIHRTSLDAIPEVKVVKDIEVKPSIKNSFTEKKSLYELFGYMNNRPSPYPSINDIYFEFTNNSYIDWNIKLNLIKTTGEPEVKYTLDIANAILVIDLPCHSGINYISILERQAGTYYWKINNTEFNEFISTLGLSIKVYSEDVNYRNFLPFGYSCEYTVKTNTVLGNTVIDNGMIGYTIDPSELLYKGGEYIIPKTIAQKDGVLFLGNIKLDDKERLINTEIDDYIKKNSNSISDIKWNSIPLNLQYKTDLYPSIQLEYAEKSFRTFKSRETYRIGLQCQTKTGKWLNPIFIKDSKVDAFPSYKYTYTNPGEKYEIHTVLGQVTLNKDLCAYLYENNIRKCRAVIVYPTDLNREIISQGILNPTVFNTKQKYENTCDAQCSWLFRPQVPNQESEGVSIPYKDIKDIQVGYYTDNRYVMEDNYASNGNAGNYATKAGWWPESKHYTLLPPNYSPVAELPHMQYTYEYNYDDEDTPIQIPYKKGKQSAGKITGNEEDTNYRSVDYYAVDKNIITFHSPELEKGNIKNIDGYKLRYIGIVTCDRCNKGFEVQFSNANVRKVYSPTNNIEGTSAMFLGNDYMKYGGSIENLKYNSTSPWWFNYLFSSTELPEKEAEIKKQYVSNNIISYNTAFFNEPYSAYTSDIKLFSGDLDTLVLESSDNAVWKNSKRKLIYKGNVNDILTAFKTVPFNTDLEGPGNIINILKNNEGAYANSYLYTAKYSSTNIGKTYAFKSDKSIIYSTKSPVIMQYKSTPHAVIALEHSKFDGEDFSQKNILPLVFKDGLWDNEDERAEYTSLWKSQALRDWDGTYSGVIPSKIIIDDNAATRYLILAELYREVQNKFGDIENDSNLWYPAGPSISINNNTDNILSISYGDTFFSRYDCLKTYPYNEDSVFNVVDIATFFVETRINTDLRYDNNKGNISNVYARPQNFNLFNDAYNQLDNFFNYRIQDESIVNNINFPTTITWSKQKIYGELIDTWSNITMASTQDLEGIDGELIKIYNFKNELFCFQPKAFNHVLYNSRIQVNSSDGVPIEIANSGRVQGFRKIANVGIPNLKSVNDNNSYLYFADSITKSIYKYDGSLVSSLTDQLNFSTWAKYNIQDDFEIYVDNTNKNIYFNNPKEGKNILGYSETLQEFESFYSYKEPIIKGNNNSFILSYSDSAIKLYSLYSNIEPKYEVSTPTNVYPLDDSYVSIITNNSSSTNKCFTGIEFRADSMDIDTPDWEASKSDTLPFTRIKVEDSHLNKEETLVYNKYRPSNTKKKFNTWRIEFPRVLKDGKYLRFNNPWVKTTLTFNRSGNYLGQEIHDLNVTFIE